MEVYKIYHNIWPTYMGALFINKVQHFIYINQGIVKSLKQPRFNTVTFGRDSFSYQGAKEWNILGSFITDAASLNEFKMLRHGMVKRVTVVAVIFLF